MSKIILCEKENFQGKYMEFVGDMTDLTVVMFANVARSVKVVGNHWVTYKEVNFEGEFFVLGAGDHPSLKHLDQQISSLRLVKDELVNPEIKLFEDVNYMNKSANVSKKVDDVRGVGFNNKVSSHMVKRGVWILHQDIEQAGPRLITFQGDEWPNYSSHGWNAKLSSLRPLITSDFEV